MTNLLQKLENNEAVLLMYLADELPPDDRVEVEQMLATDPSLRAELSELKVSWDAGKHDLARLDRLTRGPVQTDVAVRSTLRAMRRHLLEQPHECEVETVREKSIFPRWAYVAAAASVAVFSYIAWWGLRSDKIENYRAGQGYANVLPGSGFPADAIDRSADSILHDQIADQLEASFLPDPGDMFAAVPQRLNEVELMILSLEQTDDRPFFDLALVWENDEIQ